MNKRGFTLIELLLSMSFLSMLLVFIGLLSIQISNIYNKGTTFRAVNQAGIEISSDLTATLNQSSPSMVKYVPLGDKGGRLCTGSNTYAWNYAPIFNADLAAQTGANRYGDGSYDIHFVKVSDTANTLCKPQNGTYNPIDRAKASELLPEDNKDVAVYKLAVNQNSLSGNQTIFSVAMTLGTNTSGSTLGDDRKCKPASQGDDSYCAVNDFEFTARAGNNANAGGN